MSVPPRALAVIAAYRFVDIDDGEALRRHLRPPAQAAGLTGTAVLAPEGIDVAPAGEGGRAPSVDAPTLGRWLQGKTVVSYGAGGSRCEKTAGATRRRGRCVVFDEREAIDSHLEGAR